MPIQRDDPCERQLGALRQPHRQEPAQRIPYDDRSGSRLLRHGLHHGDPELVELRQHRCVGERVGVPEPTQVDGDRPAVTAAEQVEHEPPGVRAVTVAVKEHQRHAVALEFQHSGLGARV